eukprot:2708203-Rhodomonas_salina.3
MRGRSLVPPYPLSVLRMRYCAVLPYAMSLPVNVHYAVLLYTICVPGIAYVSTGIRSVSTGHRVGRA